MRIAPLISKSPFFIDRYGVILHGTPETNIYRSSMVTIFNLQLALKSGDSYFNERFYGISFSIVRDPVDSHITDPFILNSDGTRYTRKKIRLVFGYGWGPWSNFYSPGLFMCAPVGSGKTRDAQQKKVLESYMKSLQTNKKPVYLKQ